MANTIKHVIHSEKYDQLRSMLDWLADCPAWIMLTESQWTDFDRTVRALVGDIDKVYWVDYDFPEIRIEFGIEQIIIPPINPNASSILIDWHVSR